MSARYHETFPGSPGSIAAVRRAVAAVARDCGMTPQQLHDVRLAVSEAVSNAVVHAYADRTGEITVDARVEGQELLVTVGDRGGGLVPRPDSPGLGLGLPLIVALTSRFEICNGEGSTEVIMAFDCPGTRSGDRAAA
jgi:anti-sigma regulatory factor (Ser/Thr protein kinase)